MLNKEKLAIDKSADFIAAIRSRCMKETIENLSAELIVLNKSHDIDKDAFKDLLIRNARTNYLLGDAAINGKFIQEGEFVSHDVQYASEELYKSLLDSWLIPHEDYVGEQEIVNFRQYFYEKYFSQYAITKPSKAANLVTPYYLGNSYSLTKQREVLKGIIAGYIQAGHNVLHELCPLVPQLEYRITTEFCTPIFKRLIERRGDSLILLNADVKSMDFLLAFVESLSYELAEHRREFVLRMATLLLNESQQI